MRILTVGDVVGTSGTEVLAENLAKIKEMHDKMSRQYSEYELNAQRKADAIVKNANEEAASIVKKAREEVNAIWSALQTKFDGYVAEKKQ